MTRITQQMELLTTEVERFQNDVKRLEGINENLQGLRVSIDLKELKTFMDHYNNLLKRQSAEQNQFYIKMDVLFKKTKVFLTWLMITFILTTLLIGGSIIYILSTKVNAL
ncbi:hypothetical protein I215_09431 [Galbibacter marinus]|uniref:Uncharacterized protein n=1 Tax=Galbibacter marinus TaxID=555500 RepID=K2P1Z2_9FLAO|nr:DUF6730 family protein [Galbibacter marinus]EKF55073.1 hypothetical protein I215_09431 [Galbibacter marinus]